MTEAPRVITPEQEMLTLIQSDYKLWEAAATEDMGGGSVKKTLAMPWGIGDYEVTLEGLTDGPKRRDAVTTYAAHIRAVVKDKTDDEAIEARAIQAAARTEPEDSGDGAQADTGGAPDTDSKTPTVQESKRAHEEAIEEDADLGTILVARATTLRDIIKDAEADLTRWRRELTTYEAAIGAWEDEGGS